MGQIDLKVISQGTLGPRSFSPCANRKFPPRPPWGDQHVHTGWSFDAGFFCTLSPEDAPASVQKRAYTSPIWYAPAI